MNDLVTTWNQEMLTHLKNTENVCSALLLCHRTLIRWYCMLRLKMLKNTNKYWKILKRYWTIFALHRFFAISNLIRWLCASRLVLCTTIFSYCCCIFSWIIIKGDIVTHCVYQKWSPAKVFLIFLCKLFIIPSKWASL